MDLKLTFTIIGLLLFSNGVFSQDQITSDTLLQNELSEIRVTAPRFEQSDLNTAQSITVVQSTNIQEALPQLTANESLVFVPGLFALNAENFAQDLRVSIRGYGARAAFGIRGLKVLVDGLPETTPDGQSQVDNLDMGIIDQIEVIRGPSSGQYGNASGGVLAFQSEAPPTNPFVEGRATFGSYGLQRYQFKTGQQFERLGYFFHASHTKGDGYRDHSQFENNLFNGKLNYRLPKGGELKLIFNYVNSPTANDPGGINQEQADDAPDSARDRNVSFNAGEKISQGKIGLVYDQPLQNQHRLQAHIFYINRQFDARLPFEGGGQVAFDRNFFGTSVAHIWRSKNYFIKTGIDFQTQTDDRQRFNNLEGNRGALSLDQDEIFTNFAIYQLHELEKNNWLLRAALRFDVNTLEAADRFKSDGDNSGDRSLNAFNPSLGVSYRLMDQQYLSANFSTSFETPTLGELSNNPNNTGGFNDNLDPQNSRNYELGYKGILAKKFKFGLSAFFIQLENEIVPYELEQFPGRTFYRNAGQSERLGIEWSNQYNFAKGWNWFLNYTFANYTYTDYVADGDVFDGNQLPALPQHVLFNSLNYQAPNGLFVSLQGNLVGSMFTNDANTVEEDAYLLLNFRSSYTIHGKNG